MQNNTENETSTQSIINVSNTVLAASLNKTNQLHSVMNSLSLKYILKNIIEWIIVSGIASQKLRINLYASLLNYLHIIKRTEYKENIEVSSNDL